ncbi:MAG: VCBS repeat-containing protein [Nitrospirae bacterium]|nr:VCBS repeat-containing protein [Nitrospirota bacterium]
MSTGDNVFSTNVEQPGLCAYNGSGETLSGWPRSSANYAGFPAALSDVDDDGLDEIFVDEADWQFHAYKTDGTIFSGWPIVGVISQKYYTPAIADLDRDGDLEIVAVARSEGSRGALYVYHHTGTIALGFPVLSDGFMAAYPVIGDVDGDGQLEIVTLSEISDGTQWLADVLIYNVNGVLKRSIPVSGTHLFPFKPALADLNSDGIPEIIVQTDSALNVMRGDGTNFPCWPIVWGNGYWLGFSGPVVGDVDGDGFPDIVVTTEVVASGETGVVRVYGRNGASHSHFPKTLPIGSGAVPAIADIDGDGRNEIIITGSYWSGQSGYYDKVWVYDLGGATHGPVLWGQFMGNAKHTGTAVPPSPSPIKYYSLNITITGNGSVMSNPAGINCGSDCEEKYESGTDVMLTATPSSGSYFAGWTGDSDCLDGVVTMNNSKACIATFNAFVNSDLIISALTAPTKGIPGSTITITDTTKNQGTVAVAASITRFYWSTDSAYSADDIYLGERAVPVLAPGAANTGNTTMTVPLSACSRTYFIIARADAGNSVPEANETNNTKFKSIKTGPDLIVSAIELPSMSGEGNPIPGSDTIKNQGGCPAGASTIRFYLSLDLRWDTSDTPVGERAVEFLAPGAIITRSNIVTIPDGTATGIWYIIARADADEVVSETSETNNNKADSIKIGPDLIASRITVPTSATRGMTITVKDITKNNGGGDAGASTTRYYLSTNTTYESGVDTELGTGRPVPALLAGAINSGSQSVTIPSGIATGAYYIIAVSDANKIVTETSETNNNKYKTITIN